MTVESKPYPEADHVKHLTGNRKTVGTERTTQSSANVAHGVMFHHFHGGSHPVGQGSISAEDLANLLEFVGPHRILSAREWLQRAIENRLNSEDVCLTFDDNLMCQFDIALPVLQQFGLTAFWFAYTSVIEGKVEPLEVYRYFRTTQFESVDDFYKAFHEAIEGSSEAPLVRQQLRLFDSATYLSECSFYSDSDRRFRFMRDEVLGPERYSAVMDRMIASANLSHEELGRGLWIGAEQLRILSGQEHVVGLHSHTHPTRLNRLSHGDQRAEYERNHAFVTQTIGAPPRAMSHPCNSYNASTLAILKELGIEVGFRANMIWLPQYVDRSLEHPREDHADLMKQMCDSRV
ncbi:MAG TPA: polysaccharide deacetylase family protein [Candidatus Sulfotelmatobacter sp.]|nr:polysaccharide deacetylase family protein [Candidatus Sulfotelmatobacter sp.]